LPYRWELIVLLWLAFFLNQADRQIYNNLLPLIQADLGASKVQLGLVASIFTLAYGLMVPVGGYVGDVLRRKWIIVGALLFWSVATLLTGFCAGVVSLILFRGLATGGGEAFYYPSANSLIGQFHHRTRAMAMAIHQTALYVGIVASFVAGYVGEMFGWRAAFFLFGGFGILMAGVIALRVENTPQERNSEGKTASARLPIGVVLGHIRRKPTIWFLCAAFAAHVFVSVGYLTWMPTFLHEKCGMSVTAAGFSSLFYHHLFAFFGVLIGGKLSDRWATRRRKVRMEFEYAGMMLAAPCIVGMALSGSLAWCVVALAAFGLFRGFYDSNLFAALFDVIEPRYRSSAVGAMLCFAFVSGAAAPVLLGWTENLLGMDYSMALLGAVYFLGGVIVLAALGLTFARDYYHEPPTSETDP